MLPWLVIMEIGDVCSFGFCYLNIFQFQEFSGINVFSIPAEPCKMVDISDVIQFFCWVGRNGRFGSDDVFCFFF